MFINLLSLAGALHMFINLLSFAAALHMFINLLSFAFAFLHVYKSFIFGWGSSHLPIDLLDLSLWKPCLLFR